MPLILDIDTNALAFNAANFGFNAPEHAWVRPTWLSKQRRCSMFKAQQIHQVLKFTVIEQSLEQSHTLRSQIHQAVVPGSQAGVLPVSSFTKNDQ